MADVVTLPEETISLDDDPDEERRRQEERERDEIMALAREEIRRSFGRQSETLAPVSAPRPAAPDEPVFQRDPAREAQLQAITGPAEDAREPVRLPEQPPRYRSSGTSAIDPDVVRRVLARGRPVEGARGLTAPAQRDSEATPASATNRPPRDDAAPTERELYQRALDAQQKNRRRNMIIGLIGALVGRAKPQDIQALNANNDVPLREYEGGRRIREAERSRSAQERREASQLTRQERADASLAQRRRELSEQGTERLSMQRDEMERRSRLDESTIALRDVQVRAAQGDEAAQAELRDPSSGASQLARQLVRWSAGQVGGVDVSGIPLDDMSAADIESTPGARNLLTAAQNRRRGAARSGAGRAGGTSARRLGEAARLAAQMRRANYTDEQMAAEFERLGLPLPEGDPAASRFGGSGDVPGWTRQSGAGSLSAPEYRSLREMNATMHALGSHIDRMQELAAEVSAAERVGNRAVVTARMEDARTTHEMISNALRNVGNYGVPQAAELARMEALAPRLTSADGLVNAIRAYGGMRTALTRQVDRYMEAYGYDRDRGAGRSAATGRASAPATDAVRFRDPSTGRTGTAPREVVERRGFEVLE